MYAPKWLFLLMYKSHDIDVWDRLYLGRAPRTRAGNEPSRAEL